MIKLENINVYPWPYGEFNAGMYLLYVLEFNSNLELLLECDNGEFVGKLNLHEFLFDVDDLPTMEDKFSLFEDLELSNWSMEQTFASAVCFLLQQAIHRKNLDVYICVEVEIYMEFFCHDNYSDLLIEIYDYFNIFKLYPSACMKGCASFFQSTKWESKTKEDLNHSGLKNFLTLMQIDSTALVEIINVCNFVESTVPFVLSLKKYKEKN